MASSSALGHMGNNYGASGNMDLGGGSLNSYSSSMNLKKNASYGFGNDYGSGSNNNL